LCESQKKEILLVIHASEKQGLTRRRICMVIQISERRIRHWEERMDRLTDQKPGCTCATHRLLPEEKSAILVMGKNERYVDDSHRVLAARGTDIGLFHASVSTVYRVLRKAGLTTDRSGRAARNGKRMKPDRPELTGPNQRWCWDISYLKTTLKRAFLYLYVLLDEYSRKVIAWRISWSLSHTEGKELIEDGLIKENLSGTDGAMPDIFNDRGVQMKAKPLMAMLQDLGMIQKFSRPRTPNDNPFIESHFSIVKGHNQYPEEFPLDEIFALTYFTEYFLWYNNDRLHGGIGFVTPVQRHTGEDRAILAQRKLNKTEARRNRIAQNSLGETFEPELFKKDRNRILINSKNGL
jgi:transposase InsO family protein